MVKPALLSLFIVVTRRQTGMLGLRIKQFAQGHVVSNRVARILTLAPVVLVKDAFNHCVSYTTLPPPRKSNSSAALDGMWWPSS